MADNRGMPEHLPDLRDPRQRHEERDVNIWAIGKVGAGLIITTIASAAIVWGLFAYLRVQYNAQPPEHGIDINALKRAPAPNLLYNEHEAENLREILSSQEQALNGYSWVDQQHTQVKIPISRAIDELVQKGLPVRAQGSAPAAGDVSVPTAAGLGPKMLPPGGPLASELAGEHAAAAEPAPAAGRKPGARKQGK
jgi:hypothetical protein